MELSPSLISLTVSVDVKHYVLLLLQNTHKYAPTHPEKQTERQQTYSHWLNTKKAYPAVNGIPLLLLQNGNNAENGETYL